MMQAVERYLAVRHTAGFDLTNAEYLLRSFARVAAERGETTVRAATAIDWASQSSSVAQRDERLKTVCRLARYMRAEDHRHDIPPPDHFGYHKIRRIPHIYSNGEITRLIDATRHLGPPNTSQPHTYATLIGLLVATGLRISEALSLQFSDVTPSGLLIRNTKFQKTRLVPLHDTAVAGLDRHLKSRRRRPSEGEHVFVTEEGRPLRYPAVYDTFQKIVKLADLAPSNGRRLRLHEMRQHAGSRLMPGSASEMALPRLYGQIWSLPSRHNPAVFFRTALWPGTEETCWMTSSRSETRFGGCDQGSSARSSTRS